MISLASQLSALRRMNSVDQDLKVLDKRLNTGIRVADTRDSTAALAAARASGARSTSFFSVQNSLDLGISTVATASAAITAARSFLGNIRDLLEAAKNEGADLSGIQAQLTEQRTKLRSTVSGATFKSVNLLASGTSTAGYTAAPKDAAGRAYAIDIDRSRTRLLDTRGTTGLLQKTFDLTGVVPSSLAPSTLGLDGTASQTAGSNASAAPGTAGLSGTASTVSGLAANAAAPATTGLSGAATAAAGVVGTAPATTGLSGTAATVTGQVSPATFAKAILGTYDPADTGHKSGDTIRLEMNVNGVVKTVEVYTRVVDSAATFKTELQRAVDAQYGAGVLVADVAADNKISVRTIATGAGQSIGVTNVSVVDGDDVTTSTLALQSQPDFSYDSKVIDGATHVYDSLEGFDLSGLDKTDRIHFEYVAYLNDADYAYGHSITVKLANVTDIASLAAAMDQAIVDDTSYSYDYFAGVTSDGINILFYQKTEDIAIVVWQITALNGDGIVSGNLGLTTGSATGGAAVNTAASATTGSDFSGPVTLGAGAALRFDLTVNGTMRTVTINKATVDAALTGQSGYTAGSGTIADVGQLALVAQRALADASIGGFGVSASGNRLTFTMSGATATGDAINVSNVQAVASAATAATLTTGSDFAGPVTVAANASLDFTLTVDGAATNVSVRKADVETALAGRAGYTNGSGTIADAAGLALAVQAAMTRQGLSGVAVTASGNRLQFAKTATGSGTLALSNVAGASTATNAVTTAGSDFTAPVTVSAGAAITFDLALDGGAARAVRIEKATVEAALAGVGGRTSGTGTIASVAEFALVAQRALADAGVAGITVGTAGNRLTFTRAAAGAGSVTLSAVAAAGAAATSASLTTGSDFAGPVIVDAGATIGFDLAVDGGAATRVTIQRSTVEAALAGVAGRTSGTGTIANASEFALVVGRALTEAGVSGVTATASGNRIKLAKTAAGAGQVAIANVTATAAVVTTASTTTLDSINLGGTFFAGLSASQRGTLLGDYVSNIEAMARRVGQASSYLELVGRQLDIQSRHTGKLQGIETSRVGALVNTNMGAEEARRTALEARLGLARRSIEIVNTSRKNVLNIFG